MTGLAQNEMKAKRSMPLLVRSMEGLGVALEPLLLVWRPRHWRNQNGAPPCVLELYSQLAVCPNWAQRDTRPCVRNLGLPIGMADRRSSEFPARSLAVNSERVV